jgi:hypothetical protein
VPRARRIHLCLVGKPLAARPDLALGRFQNGKRVFGCRHAWRKHRCPAFVEAANIADANTWKAGGVVFSTDDKWEAS